MELRLEHLKLQNFKGCTEASYSFGDETEIRGKNAAGKTTIVDAFFWLLFDRDSRGNMPGSDNFREKPIDEFGQERHYLDTTVEAICTLDGHPFNLKRTQRENWVTKRGTKDAKYEGNTSTYWINDVETKTTDYKARIAGIANGDVFSLIARLGAFNALDEKKKRSILLEIAGVDVDTELLAREEYVPLAQEMEKRGVSIDDLKKVMSDQRKKINLDMLLIPAKIDEVNHMMPQYTEDEIHTAELNRDETDRDIEHCKELLLVAKSGDRQVVEAGRNRLAAEQELIQAKKAVVDAYDAEKRRLTSERDALKKSLEMASSAQMLASNAAAKAAVILDEANKTLNADRQEWLSVRDSVFQPGERPEVCDTCGQPISDECWQRTVDRKRKMFEAEKKGHLEAVGKRGGLQGKKVEEAEKAVQEAQEALRKADENLKDAVLSFNSTSDLLNAYPAQPDLNTPEIKALEAKAEGLRLQSSASNDREIENLNQRIAELTERNQRAREIIQKVDQRNKCLERMKELETQQTELGQKKADLELKIFSIEKFVSDRCNLLEQSINEKFPTVRWKLFNTLINGAVVDCCECLVPGDGLMIPYSSTNNAARINADIEIIGVLSDFFDMVAPVFVDNAESVNYIAKPKGQLITLSVSLDDRLVSEIKNREA